jgi:transposase-like protein
VAREYKVYTEEERQRVLAVAVSEGLSATKVHERFGVKPVTYYSWRKKGGLRSSRGRPARKAQSHSSTAEASVAASSQITET